MRAFLTRGLLFGLPILIVFAAVAFLADGYTDAYYLRLTSPRQKALIIGSSRAGQGLLPGIFNRELANDYPQPLYNFSFNAAYSPFGETYLDAIRKKLDEKTQHGLFIVTVDPWSLASDKQAPEDPALFQEKECMLGHNPWINTAPCFIYLVKDYPMPYLTLLTGKIHRRFFHFNPDLRVHEDGWLEITTPMDSASIQSRMHDTHGRYREMGNTRALSHTRLLYLVKTIAFLKQHGDVYLVRLPAHPNLLGIENQVCPTFNHIIDSIAQQQQLPFYSFTDSCTKYRYTDGTHLWKGSAALVSTELARLIIRSRHSR